MGTSALILGYSLGSPPNGNLFLQLASLILENI